MNHTAVNTQNRPSDAQSATDKSAADNKSAAGGRSSADNAADNQSACDSGAAESSTQARHENGTAASEYPLKVRMKQVKTVVKEITKERKSNGTVKSIRYWEVRVGSAVSKVYSTPSGERELFTVAYSANGKRKRTVLPTKDEAIDAAKKACGDMGSGKMAAPDIEPQRLLECARGINILAPYNARIDVAAEFYAECRKRRPEVTPMQILEYYEQRHPLHLKQKMVHEVVSEMLEVKRSDKLSERYLKQLEYDLERFSKRFRCRLMDVVGTDMDQWLRDLGVGPRTRNNLRNSVNALFKFGVARKYLAKDHDEIDAVPVVKDAGGEIEIYTPDELNEVLTVASPEHIPFLAISAFAGVRHAELQRLDWTHVNRKAQIIEIKAGTAKTASRRVIPILPNLAKWLKPHWKTAGAVCGYANMVLQFVELTRRVNEKRRANWAKENRVSDEKLKAADKAAEERLAKLTRNQRRTRGTVMPGAETSVDEGWKPFLWKHNALRHSFISYRVAQLQNVAQVALEAGNSPQMIFQHYRELVRPKDAKAWFALAPKNRRKERKIIPLDQAA
jgi:integrase